MPLILLKSVTRTFCAVLDLAARFGAQGTAAAYQKAKQRLERICLRVCVQPTQAVGIPWTVQKSNPAILFLLLLSNTIVFHLFTRKIDAFFSCQISGNSVFKPLGHGEFDRESFVLVQPMSCFSIFDRSNFMSDRRFRRMLLSRVYLSELCLLGTCFHMWNTP